MQALAIALKECLYHPFGGGLFGALKLAWSTRALNPLMERRVLPIAEGLADGKHSAIIRSANGPPSAFLVGRAAPLPWLWVLAPALLLIALVVVGALIGNSKR